jgi:hypothetical protein
MSQINCARCGRTVDDSQAFYEEDGQICAECMGNQQVQEGFIKAMKGTAGGSLGAGIVSLIFNPFFAMSIICWGAGVTALRFLWSKDPEIRKISRKQTGAIVMTAIGFFLGVIRPFLAVFSHFLAATG